MKELLHDRFLVGEVYYEPPRRRKPFTAGLQHRFYKDSSLEAHRHAEHRRKYAIMAAEAKAAIVTRKMLREMQQIRRLQDKLTRQQGEHLQAGETKIAATLIQSMLRARRARRRLRDAQALRALRVIRKVIMRHVEKKRRNAAAAVQAVRSSVRQRLAKLEAVPFLRCRMAATSIQSVWRLALMRQQVTRRRIVRKVSNQFVEAAIAFTMVHFIRTQVRPIVAASRIQRSWRRTLRRVRAMDSTCEWQRVKANASTLDKDCNSAPLNRKRHTHEEGVRGLRNEKSSTSPLTACTTGKKPSTTIADVQRESTESSATARCTAIQPAKVTHARAYKQASKPGRKPLRSAKTNEADNFEANEARKVSSRRRQMPGFSRVLKAGKDELNRDLTRSTKIISEKTVEKTAGDKQCCVVADFSINIDNDLNQLAEDPIAQLSCSRPKTESKQVLGSVIRSPNPPDVGPSARSLGLQSFRRSIGHAGDSPVHEEHSVHDDYSSIFGTSPAPHQPVAHFPAMQPCTTVEADEASQRLSSTLAHLAQVGSAEDGSSVDAPPAIGLSTRDLSIPKAGASVVQAQVSHDYTDDFEEDYEDEFSSEEG